MGFKNATTVKRFFFSFLLSCDFPFRH